MNKLIIVGLLLITCLRLPAQDQSVLADGQWYKVAVSEDGIYKLNRSQLADMGIDVSSIDPRKLKVFGNAGGMLPQANNVERPYGLVESAIEVTGESDGSFDNGDLLIFYAHGPDAYQYDLEGSLTYAQNKYATENFYFITVGATNGKRVSAVESLGEAFPKVTSFNDFAHHERSLTNLLISGREWYGEKFDLTTTYDIDFQFEGVLANSDIKVTSKVMAQSFATSSFNVSVNGSAIGEHTVGSVPDFNQSFYRYSVKGKEDEQIFTVDASEVSGTDNLVVNYDYQKNSSDQSLGFLDRVTVEVERNLQWYGETTIFRSLQSLDHANTTYEINEADDQLRVWNISDHSNPFTQQYALSGANAQFGANSTSIQEYAMFKTGDLPSPDFVGSVNNQNLKGLATPDLLIVTHPNFISEAQRLASFRQSHDGLEVQVVTTEQVFNEFASGRQDVTAIRDFAKFLYDKSANLKYLLLFGRGSYDYLDIIPNNTNYVPIYESRNSLHPLSTYGSDDYYGFLEDDEGEWAETSNGGHTMDIGVGRLPVATAEEARGVVNKLITYATDKKNYGSWRNEITFVADDGDQNLHQRQSDELTRFIDTTYNSFIPSKLYLDAYEQIPRPNGEISPAASEALDEAVDQGSLIVNFTGHGGEVGWMQEQVLDIIMIRSWNNINRLPLFVTATCEFSRHDDPRRVSGGELVVTNPKGGGIGIVSTCRPVNSSSNFELNKAFYNAAFLKENNEPLRLGNIFRLTKNNESVNQVGNRNFALLGDPSMRLAYPKNTMQVTSVKKEGVATDTIHALSNVQVQGEILNNMGQKDQAFNGTFYAVVYDKESSFATLGDENPPFNYYAKENVIFKGKGSVSDGSFTFDFIVPKNISYQFDEGQISLYAENNEKTSDANGTHKLMIGGSNPNPGTDNQGPEITLYLGDTVNNSFKDVAANTNLIAYLSDESGINISGYGVGNSLMATIDDSITYVVNDFYEASNDTYENGWVEYPLKNLTKGKHTLTFKAWDTFNNSSEKTITFTVFDPDKINISTLQNIPNPFTQSTVFTFQHNRAGEDLYVGLDILDRMGRVVQKFEFDVEDSGAIVNLLEWDGTNSYGTKLRAGLYLYKLRVRSNRDGAQEERYERLLLIN